MPNLDVRTKWSITVVILALTTLILVLLVQKPVPVPQDVPPKNEEPLATTTVPEIPWQTMSVIGNSVEGRPIEAHTFGNGSTSVLFVGGIHGGYEWNSVLLAYEVMDYLANFPETVPEGLTIHVIPSLNPDGVAQVVAEPGRFTLTDVASPRERVAKARFNANSVDLNRNFDCKWQPTSTWRTATVSAGTAAFSEPETRALRDYILNISPRAAVFWHSQANNVYASECENGVLPETLTLMNTYAGAAGYGAVATFDAYPVTGDAEGWLASIGIPAITVELKGYETSEWSQNFAGTKAVIDLYQTTP